MCLFSGQICVGFNGNDYMYVYLAWHNCDFRCLQFARQCSDRHVRPSHVWCITGCVATFPGNFLPVSLHTSECNDLL